jgi:hypothetical protein
MLISPSGELQSVFIKLTALLFQFLINGLVSKNIF